ncbi:EAL domain-containing protein [Synechocystis sp. LKSZ1]|uniref:EAL domain-containing protein n=1 Tax=Synechocystis sp. LKSZ1 TaxID=3144951 RepID=UPI00336BFEC9
MMIDPNLEVQFFTKEDGASGEISVTHLYPIIDNQGQDKEQLELLEKLTQIISRSNDFNQALTVVLKLFCQKTGWNFGEAWLPNRTEEFLEYSPAWFCYHDQADVEASLTQFRNDSEHYTFKPFEGLPGKVWLQREAIWVSDVSQDASFLRHHLASHYGLKSAVGVPILCQTQVVAVLIFFMCQSRPRDAQLIKLISAVSTQLGDLFRRKQIETSLLESQQQLNGLINSIPGTFFRTSNQPNFPLIYVSDGFQRLTGYRREELLVQDAIDFARLMTPEDRKMVLNILNNSIVNQAPYIVEYPIQTKQKEEKWVLEKGQGFYNQEGQFLGVIGYISDISERKQMEEALRSSEAELRGLFAGIKDVILVLNREGRYLKIAPTNCNLLYQPVDTLLDQKINDIFPAEQATLFLQAIHQSLDNQKTVNLEYSLEIQGQILWFDAYISPTGIDTVIWVARDMTHRKLAEQEIRAAETKYRNIYENSLCGIFQSTLEGQYLSANPALAKIYGYESPEKLLESLTDISHQLYVNPQRRQEFIQYLQAHEIITDFVSPVYHRSGKVIWISENARVVKDTQGQLLYYEGMVEDVTYRLETEQELHNRAYFDPLTELPNRILFTNRLNEALIRFQQNPQRYHFAVLFLDLDRFKVINDSLGHWAGDQLLIKIARKLEHCIRPKDIVARIGGDEFIILLEHLDHLSQAIKIAERIKNELKIPFTIEGNAVFTGVSIGIICSEQYYELLSQTRESLTTEIILRDADIAMYQAKAQGKGNYQIFSSEMRQKALALMDLETSLRQALEAQEFQIHYQPILSLTTGDILGFESLLRWQHPQQGLIFPDKFISLLEDTGMIIPLGSWILRESCRQLKTWQSRYPHCKLTINVNLSLKQLAQPSFLEEIDQILVETGLHAQYLKLEITESHYINDEGHIVKTLEALRNRNIQLCIDDFGTGYSSLNYLHQLPINVVKIDRSFVKELESESAIAKITKTIFSLTQSLGLDAVAEGIETPAQLEKLRLMGCQFGQGYLFSRPLSAVQIDQLLLSTFQPSFCPGAPWDAILAYRDADCCLESLAVYHP